jgi:hypothetical protein
MSANNERFARALLSTLSQDQPSPGARRKVMAATCAGSAAGAVVSAAAGVKAAVGANSAAAASVGALGIGKAFVAGALAAVVTVQVGEHVIAPMLDGSAHHAASSRPAAPPAPKSAPPTSLPRSLGEENVEPIAPSSGPSREVHEDPAGPTFPPGATRLSPPPPVLGITTAGPVSREPSPKAPPSPNEFIAPLVTATPPPSAHVDSAAPPAANNAPTLLEEIRRLDRARTALRAGSAAQAAQELDRYDTDFPSGSLRPEAMVVRIELLVITGDDAGARSIARAFANAYPTSGHLPKIRHLLAVKPAQ